MRYERVVRRRKQISLLEIYLDHTLLVAGPTETHEPEIRVIDRASELYTVNCKTVSFERDEHRKARRPRSSPLSNVKIT